MHRIARPALRLLLLCALATPAVADEVETVTAVYHGAEDTAENAGAVASILALLDPPVTPGAPPAHLDRHFAPGEIQVFAAGAQRCTSGPMEVGTYRELLADLYRASMALEDTETIRKAILSAQPCVAEPLGGDLLARVHFLDGVFLFEEDQDAARAAFHRVHAIDPSYAWDDSFPPIAQVAFADAKLAVLNQAKVPVRLYLPAQAAVFLDGKTVPPGRTQVEVYPGRHLVQLQAEAEGPLRSVSIEVAADTPAALFDPAILAAPDRADIDGATTAFIRHLAAATDAGVPDYVVALSPEIVIWRWSTEADALERIEVPSQATALVAGKTPRPKQAAGAAPHPAVPILIGAGAGIVAVGAILAGTGYDQFNDLNADYTGQPDETDEYEDIERAFHQYNAGVGLLAGGGVVVVAAVPVGVLTAKGKKTAVTAAVQIHADPGADGRPGAGLQGATLTLGFRPADGRPAGSRPLR